MPGAQTKLVFVYNADSGPLAQAFDFLHKAISPSTYRCNLCRVSYGMFAAKKEWSEFVGKLPFPAVFVHRNEFRQRYPGSAATPLPAVFLQNSEAPLEPLVGAEELNQARTVAELKALIASKLD